MRFSRLPWLLPLLLAACTSVAPPTQAPIHSGTTPSTSSNGSVRYTPSALGDLPIWRDTVTQDSFTAFKQSCRSLARKPGWGLACQNIAQVNPNDSTAVRAYFEQYFDAWKLEDNTRDSGLITGYYEPMLNGSRSQSTRTPYPVYGVPADLVTVDTGAVSRLTNTLVIRRAVGARWEIAPGKQSPDAGELTLSWSDFPPDAHGKLKARVAGGKLLPYYSRGEIDAGKFNAPVLAWVEDPTELFFLQVQGSGRIHLDDGSVLRVNAAENNGLTYQSIGKWLLEQGKITAGQATMQGIQAWVRAHPDERLALFARNPRYIFFRPIPETGNGPLGSLGVALTGGYSLAVDPRYIPLGAPVLLSTTWPKSAAPLNRLMVAQDTGSAIKGAIRADFFWGYGYEAGQQAGSMKQQGRLWLLLPKGMRPASN